MQKNTIFGPKILIQCKKILTFEPLDGFSNFKKVNHSEFRQEFNENIRNYLDPDPGQKMDPDPDPAKKVPDPRIRIQHTDFFEG